MHNLERSGQKQASTGHKKESLRADAIHGGQGRRRMDMTISQQRPNSKVSWRYGRYGRYKHCAIFQCVSRRIKVAARTFPSCISRPSGGKVLLAAGCLAVSIRDGSGGNAGAWGLMLPVAAGASRGIAGLDISSFSWTRLMHSTLQRRESAFVFVPHQI